MQQAQNFRNFTPSGSFENTSLPLNQVLAMDERSQTDSNYSAGKRFAGDHEPKSHRNARSGHQNEMFPKKKTSPFSQRNKFDHMAGFVAE